LPIHRVADAKVKSCLKKKPDRINGILRMKKRV
jgi:hypothetical protein